jgi:hypothetical protein
MGFTTAIISLAAILAVAVVGYGAFAKRPAVLVALVAVAVAGLAGLLSWYAFAETHSTPWCVGHGVVAVASMVVAAKNLLPRRKMLAT